MIEDIDPASFAATTAIRLGEVIRQLGPMIVRAPADVAGKLERERAAGAQQTLVLIGNEDGAGWTTMPFR